ncbi:MAG: porin family protein [Bacteroidota bacterium]
MKRLSPVLLLLFFLLQFTTEITAQKKRRDYISDRERFSAGVLIGYNSSQIDGDYFAGFDKFGITGGIRGIVRLTPRIDFNVEMLYSEKGSKIEQGRILTGTNQEKSRILDLKYMDAPFSFRYLLNDKPNSWHLELGAIYSRLINSEVTERETDRPNQFFYRDILEDFRKDDISTLLGLGHTWQMGLSVNFRYIFSISKFYKDDDFMESAPNVPRTEAVPFLRNYYYSLGLSYTIFKRKIKKKKGRRR